MVEQQSAQEEEVNEKFCRFKIIFKLIHIKIKMQICLIIQQDAGFQWIGIQKLILVIW